MQTLLNYSDYEWSAVKSLNRTCEAFVKSLIGDRPLLWALWDCQWLLFPFSGNLCLLKIIASIGFEKVFRTCSKISDTSQRFKICKNSFFFITTSFFDENATKFWENEIMNQTWKSSILEKSVLTDNKPKYNVVTFRLFTCLGSPF